MESIVEMGKISTRGQIAIPVEIREKLGMRDGTKVMFITEGNMVMIKRLEDISWEELTRPLKEEAMKAGFKQTEVSGIIDQMRKERRQR